MNKILKFFITGLIGFAILFISFFVSSSPKVHSMLGIKSPKITSKDLKKPVYGYAKSKSEENVFSSSVDGYAHGSENKTENKTEDSNSTTQDTTTEQDPDDGSSGNSDNNSNIKNSSDTQKTEQSSNDNKSSGSKSKSDGHYYY